MAATEAVTDEAIQSADDCLHLDTETRKDAVRRLKRANGARRTQNSPGAIEAFAPGLFLVITYLRHLNLR